MKETFPLFYPYQPISLIHSQPLSLRLASLSLSLTPTLTLAISPPQCRSISRSHRRSRSRSHRGLTLPISPLSRSPSLSCFQVPRRLDLPSFVFADLAIMAPCPRSLLPSHGTATHPQFLSPAHSSTQPRATTPHRALSLTLTLKFCSNVGLLVVFLFPHFFSVIWSAGLLV